MEANECSKLESIRFSHGRIHPTSIHLTQGCSNQTNGTIMLVHSHMHLPASLVDLHASHCVYTSATSKPRFASLVAVHAIERWSNTPIMQPCCEHYIFLWHGQLVMNSTYHVMHLWAGVPGEPCYIPNISWLHALATPPTQFRSIDLAWASRSYKRIEIHAHLRKHARTICYYDILWSHWHASELFERACVRACMRACHYDIVKCDITTCMMAWCATSNNHADMLQ